MRFLLMAAWSLAFSLLTPSTLLWGQSNSEQAKDSLENLRITRTTRIAALVPGAGQIANRKYWKAPLVWGGMAWCISSISFNLAELHAARIRLIALEESDPALIPNFFSELQAARSEEAFYRRNRDLSWFALVGVHALSVLDAHVDANLLSFDVSENLALHIRPVLMPHAPVLLAPGLVIRWHHSGRNLTNFEPSNPTRPAFKRNWKWN